MIASLAAGIIVELPQLLDGSQAGPAPIVRTVDLRTGKEKQKDALYVIFCARSGAPGHAFVVLGKDDEAKQLCSVEAFGLYPKNALAALTFGTVPGEIANEAVRKGTNSTCRLIVKVDAKQYAAAEAVRKQWTAKNDYKLLNRDCVTFTAAVADSLGLKTPDRAKAILPQTFIQDFVDMHGK